MLKKLISFAVISMLSACAYRGMSDADKATVKYFERKYRRIERYEKRYPNDPFQPYSITGIVQDEESREPLSFSSIRITNSHHEWNHLSHFTDMDGRFVLIINDTLFDKKRKKISVLIHAEGYQDSCYIIPYMSFKNNQLEKIFFLKNIVITID